LKENVILFLKKEKTDTLNMDSIETPNIENSNTILVVDDIKANLELIKGVLKRHKIVGETAISANEAFEKIAIKKPDLILLDVAMPEMDGFEMCKLLKENDETKDIPVIFITAHYQPNHILKGFQMGAVDYIAKPFNQQELISRVQTHLKLKNANDQIVAQNMMISQQNERLTALNFTKDKFFSIIAHDLKTPFSNIITLSQMMIESGEALPEDRKKQFIEAIYQTSNEGFNLLMNLLNWSRNQTGSLKQMPDVLNLRKVVKNLLITTMLQIEWKEISLVNNVTSDIFCVADFYMLETVLRNIVSNAIKFTPKKGNIEINAVVKNNFVFLSVKDSGEGITDEAIESINYSDKFFTSKGTDNENGSGLGLKLCKEFAEKNGGNLLINRNIDGGSTITVTLPIANSE